MAAILAILSAVRRAVGRDLGSLEAIKVNNFFLFVALLVYGALNSGQPPKSAEPFLFLFGFLMLFPLSSDPLGKVPADRRALWPLSRRQRIALRFASMVLSPVFWIAVFILLRTARAGKALAFLAIAVAVQCAAAVGRRVGRRAPQLDVLRYIPQPPGLLGGLVRKNLREIFTLLDTYVAVALGVGGAVYRFSGRNTDPDAFAIIGLLVALALSTYAQSLFGLELGSGITRYRLLPLRGWEILMAKDAAFLALLVVLLLPLDPAPGLTFGFVALALGHHSSVQLRLAQQRWRFTGGRLLPVGALQAVGGMALGFVEHQRGVWILGMAVVGYAASVWYYGRRWESY